MNTLRIYPVILELVALVAPLLKVIKRHDRQLAQQGYDALTSVPLNTAEGSCSRGKNRQARYHTACGSAREVLSVLETAQAIGMPIDPEPHRPMFNQVIGTLAKLAGV